MKNKQNETILNNIYPFEGFFWIDESEIFGIKSEVHEHDYSYNLNGQTHENNWNQFKESHKVENNYVEYDYFSRGRIMVDPNYDADGKFTDYSCIVFLDKCINNSFCKDLIIDYYNLDLPTIHNITWMMLNERAGIEHYQCHNCKK